MASSIPPTRIRVFPADATTNSSGLVPNLARGGEVDAIVSALVEEGVPEPLARATVRRASRAPSVTAARAWAQVADQRAELRGAQVERVAFPGVEAFHRHDWQTNAAVCFEGFARVEAAPGSLHDRLGHPP